MKPVLILLLFFVSTAQANTYYFSATSGDDSRTSIQAQHPATPWKSLDKMNSFLKKILPGDSILLKRGDEFYGTIRISRSGSQGLPIVISAYGIGTHPVVTGFTTIRDWKSLGNGIWESAASISGLSTLNMVVIDDKVQQIGRYPNADTANKGYLKISAHTGKNSITDIFLKAEPDWTGGDIVVRSSQYSIDRAKILQHKEKTISFGDGLTYEPKYGYGYFIQNHPTTLDEIGEWYYNTDNKKLRIYYGTNPPGLVKVASLENLLRASNVSYLFLNDIGFQGSNGDAINIKGPGSDFSIQNCRIAYCGIDGILSRGEKNLVIDKCTFHDVLNEGISATDNCIIRNCTVRNTGFIAGLTQNNAGISAISNSGIGSITERNTISNTGYIGIKFGRVNSLVKNNYIDTFCTIKQDGGAIYAQGKKGEVYGGTKIIGNIVLNGLGAYEGTTTFTNNSMGIYCDDYLNNIEIAGNTVAGAAVGIMLHNNRNNATSDNIFFNNSRCQLHVISDKSDYPTTGLYFKNNFFVAKTSKQLIACYNSLTADFDSFGTMTDNRFARAGDKGEKTFRTTVGRAAGVLYNIHDFGTAFSSLSKRSKESPSVKDESKLRLEINPTSDQKSVNLNGTYIDMSSTKRSGNITLAPYTSILLVRQD